VNTPMTPAQAAQQSNRDDGGRYKSKTHAEAAVELATVNGRPAWPTRAEEPAPVPHDVEALTDQHTGYLYDTPEAAEAATYLNEAFAGGEVGGIELDEDAGRPGALVLSMQVDSFEPTEDGDLVSASVGVDALDGRVLWVQGAESGSDLEGDTAEFSEAARRTWESMAGAARSGMIQGQAQQALTTGAYPGKERAPLASEAMAEHVAGMSEQQRLDFDSRYGLAVAARQLHGEAGSQGVHDEQIVPAIEAVADQMGLDASEVRSVDGVVSEDGDPDGWEITSDLYELTATRFDQGQYEALPGGGYHHEPGQAHERSTLVSDLSLIHRVRDAGVLRERVEELEMIEEGKAPADRWLG